MQSVVAKYERGLMYSIRLGYLICVPVGALHNGLTTGLMHKMDFGRHLAGFLRTEEEGTGIVALHVLSGTSCDS